MLEVIGATVAVDKYSRPLSGVTTTTGLALSGGGKTVKPNIASGYSFGQTASASQPAG